MTFQADQLRAFDVRAPLEFFRISFVLPSRRLDHQTASYRFKAETFRRSGMFLAPIEGQKVGIAGPRILGNLGSV